ncbi:UDP-2,3-diacylglucosamine diphosphatase [Acinetobacter sp. 194]|uniref:UDP-2,3-diacylglucosamine diphosphatase n=1 Tax=Acinetobacter shaoyimingii TaxID=2715164 RepID=UPI00140E17AA|nr:UDP-2,3-diacylglucosamine diphosphatase [Acinetobacter shaoyimingii]NHB57347.1 UDP-2,3-diacylglucosamine diphosphatase [Acinetobacter shaoyimingii]
MTHLFISDLHLSPDHPRLIRGFLDLLDHYRTQETQLYILGDWFNAWIGDDYSAPWLDDIVEHLKAFTAAGNRIYFQVGNRDFALHQVFLNQFNGQLLPDIDTLTIGQTKIRIEHGDALCTDDVKYQRFKKVIRNPFLISFLRKTPLSFRTKLAEGFRKRSNHTKEFKSYEVMDVNQGAVAEALKDVDLLIHGHTHRPQIHHEYGKLRIVLGDWREDQAQILVIDNQNSPLQFQLSAWQY